MGIADFLSARMGGAVARLGGKATKGGKGGSMGQGEGKRVELLDKQNLSPRLSSREVDSPDTSSRPAPFLPGGVSEREFVAEVERCLKIEQGATATERMKWELYERFVAGQQYASIDLSRGVFDGRRDDEDVAEFKVLNLLAPTVTKVVALISASDPEVEAIARVRHPALEEVPGVCNQIIGHVKQSIDGSALLRKQIRSACIGTTCFKFWAWNPEIEESIPRYDPVSGELAGFEELPVGGIDVRIFPGRQVYVDSAAQDVDKAAYIIVKESVPLTDLQTTYGERAFQVKGDDAESSVRLNTLPFRSDSGGMTGGSSREGDKSAALLHFYVKPQPWHPQAMYREGLYACVAGGVLLHSQKWAWVDKKHYPCAWVYYDELPDTVYGDSLVARLLDLQSIVNEELRRLQNQLGLDKAVVTRELESGPASSLMSRYTALKEMILIEHNRGTTPPTVSRMPSINAAHFEMLDRAIAQIQMISGLPDVLEGAGAEAVKSGVQYEMMVETATSVHRTFIDRVNDCEKRFYNAVLMEYMAKGADEMLLSADPYGNAADSMEEEEEQKAGGAVSDLSPLTQFRDSTTLPVTVYLAPSSGSARTPAARENEMMNRFAAGLFGDPASIAALRRYWSLSDRPEAAKILKSLDEEEKQMAAMQDQQMQMEQAAQEQQIAAEQQKMQMGLEADAAKQAQGLEAQQAKAALDEEKAMRDAEREAVRGEMDDRAAMQEMGRNEARHQQEMAHQREVQKLRAEELRAKAAAMKASKAKPASRVPARSR